MKSPVRSLTVLVLLAVSMAAVLLHPENVRAAGGPVVLMGIDAEDGSPYAAHGPISVYVVVASSIKNAATKAGASGILGIGCGKASDDVTFFWSAVATGIGESLTCVNGAAAISAVNLASFKIVGIASDEFNTPGGGLTDSENAALTSLAPAIAAHVNSGGGLIGLASDYCVYGTTACFGYVGGLGSFAVTAGLSYWDVTPTPAGSAIGITDALDVCCWHDHFDTFPSFLGVLATDAMTGLNQAAAIGGVQVVIPGFILTPSSATNLVGTTHTVTAAVFDTATNNPISGATVSFTVTGANMALSMPGSCTTNTSGQCSFSYAGTNVGTDTITATVTVAGQTLTATASKTWTQPQPPAVQGRMTGGGSVTVTGVPRVTHGFELKCDVTKGPNNLQVNWGNKRFHLENLTSAACSDDPSIDPGQPVSPFDTYVGTGVGRYKSGNGAWTPAMAEWTLTDAGEPGKGVDRLKIKITVGTSVELNVDGFLNTGNHQAHSN